MEYGNIGGQAVQLDFGNNLPVEQQQLPQQQQPALNIPEPELIAMDQSAIKGTFYREGAMLQEIAASYLKNGIDVTQPPNMSDPISIRAIEEFQQLVSEYKVKAQQYAVAYNLQDQLFKNQMKGLYVSPDAFSQNRQQPLSHQDASGMFFNPESLIKNINTELSQKALTSSDIQSQQERYNNFLQLIQDAGQERGLTDTQIRTIQARINKPGGSVDPLQQARVNTEQQRARTERAKQSKQYAEANKARRDTRQVGFNPYASLAANVLKRAMEGTGSNKQGPTLTGSPLSETEIVKDGAVSFRGINSLTLDRIEAGKDGSGVMVFKALDVDDVKQRIEEDEEQFRDVQFKDGNVLVSFTQDNMLPVIAATMKPNEFSDFVEKDLPLLGIQRGGAIDANSILQFNKVDPIKASKKKAGKKNLFDGVDTDPLQGLFD